MMRLGLLTVMACCLGALLTTSATDSRARGRKDLACKKDNDCVFRPSVCGRCGPCKPTLRQVCNRKTAKRIEWFRRRARCRMPICPRCANRRNWRGTRPVCFHGQCKVAPVIKRYKKVPRSLACKRHKDCGFWPTNHCMCAPCGLRWRVVANRWAIRREMRMRAVQGMCHRPKCKKCPRRVLGSKVRCVTGRCRATF